MLNSKVKRNVYYSHERKFVPLQVNQQIIILDNTL
jgi:hypothetical protein